MLQEGTKRDRGGSRRGLGMSRRQDSRMGRRQGSRRSRREGRRQIRRQQMTVYKT